MTINDQTVRDIKRLLYEVSSLNLRHVNSEGFVVIGPGMASSIVADAERLLESLKWSEMKQGALSL